jgi:hypothetical protein
MSQRPSTTGSFSVQDDPKSALTGTEKLLREEAQTAVENKDLDEDTNEDMDEVTVKETMTLAPLYVNGPYWRTMAELAEKAGRADLAAPIRNLPDNFGTDRGKHDLYIHDETQKDDFAKSYLRIDEAVRCGDLGDRTKITAALRQDAESMGITVESVAPWSGTSQSKGGSPHSLDSQANHRSRS